MLYVNKNGTIKLTRGDTARLRVSITNESSDSESRPIGEHETLFLTVKNTVYDTTALFQKMIVGDDLFHIKPEDTEHLEYGKYKYDVQLVTESGDVYTIIEPSTFEILPEVTY